MNITEIKPSCFDSQYDEQCFSIAAYQGHIYLGTRNANSGAKLIKISADLNTTVLWNAPKNCIDIYGLVEYKNSIYFGTYNPVSGGEIYCYSEVNGVIKVCDRGIDDQDNKDIWSWSVYNNSLYAGTWNPSTGGKLYRSDCGRLFSRVFDTGNSDHGYIRQLIPWRDALWGAVGLQCEPLYLLKISSIDNNTIKKIVTTIPVPRSDIYCMSVFNDDLYLALSAYHRYERTGGAEVWRYDGSKFVPDSKPGFGNRNNYYIHSMTVHLDTLYCATYNYKDGCEIWRSKCAQSWERVVTAGFGDSNNESIIYGLISYSEGLWAVTRNVRYGLKIYTIKDL